MRVLYYDPDVIDGMENATRKEYLKDSKNFGNLKWTMPDLGWAVPFVTGHKYSFFFGNHIDIERIKMSISDNWQPNDKPITLHHLFIDRREEI